VPVVSTKQLDAWWINKEEWLMLTRRHLLKVLGLSLGFDLRPDR
jgi:hypothetical protein